MRVESSKTNQTSKASQTVDKVDKSESVFRSTNTVNSQIAVPTSAPTTGAFEKIMNEARQQSTKDDKPTSKTENRTQNSESFDIKKDEEKDVKAHEKLKQRDHNKGDGDDGGENDQENPAMFTSLGLFGNGKVVNENSIPAARSILHVADLERIVSTLRTIETNNSKQVLIVLKNSVLEGLQIKLTVDENGKLKAEFLALNEKFKEQLKARKNELSEIFKNRGVKFQHLEIKTFDETENEPKPSENTKDRIGKF
ncbi:MAG: hypothetical protein ABIP06_14975 [Pyrinomonadaceae bacterium]